jgi:hypothetical protein
VVAGRRRAVEGEEEAGRWAAAELRRWEVVEEDELEHLEAVVEEIDVRLFREEGEVSRRRNRRS